LYDAIVVGARCAGSPTAMLLARKGYRVLLVDRTTFPSDTMSTHLIKPPGVNRLKRWDLLDTVLRAANCPPISEVTFDLGTFSLTGTPPPMEGTAECYSPRRIQLDKVLVEAAVEAGAELREGSVVREILTDGARVTGVRGQGNGGTTFTEEATILVGADGLRSTVAHAVQAPAIRTNPTLTCAYYAYWSGIDLEHFTIHPREKRMVMAFPTNDGLTCVFVEWPKQEFRSFRSDVEGNFLKTVDLAPGMAERVHAGKREGRFVGSVVLPNYLRKPYGPGWTLVGDAGYHKDPIVGEGITDAFRDVELLVEAIDAGFSGRLVLEEALAEYERRRNEVAISGLEDACEGASLEPPLPPEGGEEAALLAALQINQEETNRFVGTIVGTVSEQEFFSPENVQRIISAA
jgi:flavin-dependent dehydrogenase